MKNPNVSIILPVFNASKFLKEAIDSILNQTYSDFELIMLNDGSTDDSEAIIKSYLDKRICYYYQQNQGVAATLNNGIALAKGEYIWRHDADDISLPNKLEQEISFLEANPDIALCACQVAFMTEIGKVAWNYKQPHQKYFEDKPFKIVKRSHFNPYCPITHGTVLIRTKVMKQLNGYRTQFITGEDIDLWLRLLQFHKAVVLNQCLSLHRLSSNSATQVHSWKNEFFRNLAFKFYEQRICEGIDDLDRGHKIDLPIVSVENKFQSVGMGKRFRIDILGYSYALHIDAKDYIQVIKMTRLVLKDGWRLRQTWKALTIAILPVKIVQYLVMIKRFFIKSQKNNAI